MTEITNLKLANVRSHQNENFKFVSTMNAIVGPNGSGKTTVIEALYTLLRGSSFKGSLSEVAQYGSDQYRVEAEILIDGYKSSRSLGYHQSENVSQKKWKINDKSYARLPAPAKLPVVLFEPDLARLITGSPERRRSYIDQIASQLDFEAAAAQGRFERALKQRNQLLKKLRESKASSSEELFIWNTQLSHLSEKIVQARYMVIDKLQSEISQYYRQLGGSDDILLTYVSSVATGPDLYSSRLLQFLETAIPRDIALGYTSFGPHRDELEIRLADQAATQRASRGETRTIVIALKLLETQLLAKHYNRQNIQPILLLDDVLSELDLVHQERVLEGFKSHQVFITTTDAHAITLGVHTIAL